VITKDSRGRYC